MSKLPKGLLSIGKAAAALGVSIDTLRNWEKQGKLLPVKTDAGTRKYRKADINQLIRNQGVKVRKIYDSPVREPEPKPAPKYVSPWQMLPQPEIDPWHEMEVLAPLLQEPVDPKEPSIRSLSSALDSMVDGEIKNDIIFNPAYQPIKRFSKSINIARTVSRTTSTAALGMMALAMAMTTALTMGYLAAPGLTQRAVAKLPIPTPIQSVSETLVMGFDTQQAAKLGFGKISAPRDPLIATNIAHAETESADPNSNVLGRTTFVGATVQLNANTTVFGNVFADNIVNALTAGENLTLSGSLSNPILSAELPASILNTINNTTGELTLTAGSDISIATSTVGGTTTITLSDSSTLSTVRGRGGCSACIVDGDIADDLTISSAGSVSGTAVTSGLVAAVYGGTGIASYSTGDLIYANSSTTLTNLAIGSTNQVLTVQGGVPVWTTATCQGCLVQTPTSNSTGATGANTISPAAANITGLTVLANSDSTGSPDIFRVQNAGGSTTLFKVDYAGDVTSNNTLYFGNGTTYSINSSAVATLLSIQNTPIGTVTPAAGNFSTIGATTPGSAVVTTLDSTTGTTSLATGAGSSLTIGTATGTFALTSNALNVSTTGTLSGVNSISNSGVYTQSGTSANTFTGTTTFSSSSTYAALFTGGNVGIGDTTPAYLFTVGNGDLFGVNSSGAIAAAAGITSSGTITFSNVTDGGNAGIIHSSSTGVLSSSAINLAGGANEVSGGLHPAFGGTGQTTAPTNGQLLIGNSSTSNFSLNTITAGSNFSVTNGAGTITLTPSLTPTYTTVNDLTLTSNADGYSVAGGTTSRTLTVTGSNITLTGGGNTLTLTGNTTLNQSLATSSTPLFTRLTLSNTTNQLVLGGAGSTNTTTLSSTAPSTSRTYTIPDFAANDTFVGLAATQTLTNKTLSSDAITSATISSPTITSSTITNTPIGASTPSTAVFTTLSSTGATTIGNGSTTVAVDTTSWDVSSAGAITGITGLTFASGSYNFDQSASSGTLSTGTGNISLNGDTTITAGKTLTLASGTGTFNQTFLSSTNNAAGQTLTYTNANTGASSVTVNGLNLALTNSTNTNNTNTLAGITFEAGSNNNSNVINAINFASATGFTNFLQTPSIDISSAGVITGATISGGSNTFTNIANSSLTNSSFTFQTGTGLSGGATVSLGGTLTLSNTGVTSVTGTSNQVNVSASTGAVTLSLPQSIATTSTPQFAGQTLTGSLTMSGVTTDFTSASGENIALSPNGSGKVGIGATSPGSLFSVGTSTAAGGFQVDSSGNIVKLNGITYSFPSAQAAGSAYVLQTDGSGTLSWVAQSAGTGCTPWSCLTAPLVTPTNTTGNLSLAMASYTSTFTWGSSTGASNLFNLTDTTSNTGTGYLNNITTAASSTLNPFHVGTGNGSLATDSITVLANGNVGIGTTSPSAAFSVGTGSAFQVATTGLITLNPASSTPMANISNSQTPISAGAIGTWATLNTLPALNQRSTAVSYNGYIFTVGGFNGSSTLSTVYSAQMKADGTIGTWQTLNTLPQLARQHALSTSGGYLFVTGGINSAAISTVYSAKINTDGTIGNWNTLNTLPTLLYNHSSVAYNNYLYIAGGTDGSSTYSTVYYAQINGNGTIGNWTTTSTLPTLRSQYSAFASSGYFFIFGGFNGTATYYSTVYSAPINANGTLGTWQTLTALPATTNYWGGAVVANGYAYYVGGFNSSDAAVSTVYSAQIKTDGTLGSWSTLNTTPQIVANHGLVTNNNYLYILGGFTSTTVSTVYSAPLGGTALATNTSSSWSNGNLLDLWNDESSKLAIDYAGNLVTAGSVTASQFQSTTLAQSAGSTGTYQTLANLPVTLTQHSLATYNGYIYATGGYNGSTRVSTMYAAKANADGTVGPWQTLNTLPQVLAQHSAIAANGYLFILGGFTGAATVSTVYSAKINNDGTLGSWNTLNTLPSVTWGLSPVVVNDYLYVTGGYNGSTVLSTVYSAQILSNGLIGSWNTLNTLPAVRRLHAAATYNGYIFVTGGTTGTVVSTVYSAPTKADGTIGTWQTLNTLPVILNDHSAIALNGYLYVIGGNTGSAVSTVYVAQINSDGTIGSWATLNTLPQAQYSQGTALTTNGYLFVVGGWNSGGSAVSTVYSTPLGSNALAYTTSLPQTNGNILDFWNNNTSIAGVDYTGRFLANAGLQLNQTSTTPTANFQAYTSGVQGWQAVTNLPQLSESSAIATYNGYVYVTGGTSGTYQSTVFSAKVNADGTLSAWSALNTLPNLILRHTSVAYNGYLYVIGGLTGSNITLSTVYSAQIRPDGTISSWSTLNTLPALRASHASVAYNGYLYVLGGSPDNDSTVVSTVYAAPINSNGTIGTWATLNTMVATTQYFTAAVSNGYLYMAGGYSGAAYLSTAYSAKLNADGTIGTWATLNTIPGRLAFLHSGVMSNGYLYIIGGRNNGGAAQSTIYSVPTKADGTIGTWATLNTLPEISYNNAAVVANGYIISMGGHNGTVRLSTVYSTPIQSTSFAFNTTNQFTNGNLLDIWNGTTSVLSVDYAGNLTTQGSVTGTSLASTQVGIGAGSTGSWQTINPLPAVTLKNATVYYNGYIYVAGGCPTSACASALSSVYMAKVNANGTIGGWSTLTNLPVATHSVSGDAHNGYLFIAGGNGAASSIYSAKINDNGTIGSWNTLNTMPSILQNHRVVTYGGYIFLVAGYNGAVASTVFSAQINGNGTIGTWQTLNTLPAIRSFPAVVTSSGYLFVIGGADASVSTSTAYSAPIKADGTIGTWQTLNTLPAVRAEANATISNGYIYIMGGYDGSTSVSTAYSAKILTDGTISSWATLNTLPVILRDQGLVSNGSYIFMPGGMTSAGVSTVYSIPVNSDSLAFQTINTFNAGNLLDVWNNGAQVANIDYSGKLNTNVGIQLNQLANTGPTANFSQSLNGLTAGSTGTYATLNTLPVVNGFNGSASYNGYLYVVGGTDGTSVYSTIYSAKVNADGTIGPWSALNTLPAIRTDAKTVAANGYLFVIAGSSVTNGTTTVSTVYSTAIKSDGTIGSWNTLNTLPAAMSNHAAVTSNGYIFVLGGSTNGQIAGSLSTVYSAQINGNGTIGTWQTLNTLPVQTRALSAVAYSNYIYVGGGSNTGGSALSTVYSAAVNSDGTIGSWNTLNTLPALNLTPSFAVHNGYIYSVGGRPSGAPVSTVFSAKIIGDGTIGTWATLNTLPQLNKSQATLVSNGYMFVVGGCNANTCDTTTYLSTVYSTPLQSEAFAFNTTNQFTAGNLLDIWNNGQSKFSVDYAGNIVANGTTTAGLTSGVNGIQAGGTGSWSTLATLPAVAYQAAMTNYNGYIYFSGGSGASVLSTIYAAKVNADGTIGAWNALTTLPTLRYGHNLVAANNYLFLIAGTDNSANLSTIYSAKINDNGTIGTWQTLNTLPAIRYAPTSVAVNGYLVVMGGWNGSAYNTTVWSAAINGNGTIGTWQTLTALPGAMGQNSATTYNGYIFIGGGCSTSCAAGQLSTIYSALVRTDGTIGSWNTLNTLPQVLFNNTLVAANGYLYNVGGFNATVNVSTIYSAKINTDGTIATWATLNTLPVITSGHGATVSNGYLLVAGGNNGSNLSTVYSTPLQSDAFAFNTTNSVAGAQTAGNLINVTNNGQAVASIDYSGRLNSVLGVQINNTSTTPAANFSQSLVGLGAGGTGTYATLSTYPATLNALTTVTYNGYLWGFGGFTSNVYSAKINIDGTVGRWNTLTALPATRAHHSSAVYNGYVYVIGGVTTGALGTAVSTIYSATLNGDGTISGWNTLNTLPAVNERSAAVVANGYLFVIGGGSAGDGTGSISTVYSAKINGDGSIGSWQTLNTLPQIINKHTAVVHNNYIIITGGNGGTGVFALSTVYSAKVRTDGTIGSWQTLNTLPSLTYGHTSVVHNGYIYIAGGHNGGTGLSTVYSALINADGTIGTWATLNTLPALRFYSGSATANGYMFVVGGNSGSVVSTVYSTPLQSTAFAYNTVNTLTSGNLIDVWNQGQSKVSVDYAGSLGLTGSLTLASNQTPSANLISQATDIGPGGAGTTYTTMANLPAIAAHSTVNYHNGYIFVVGGVSGSTTLSTVYSAKVNGDGSLAAWTRLNTLPAARMQHQSVAHNGYLFVGGGSPDNTSTTISTVYSAKINEDGTIGTWNTLNTLPTVVRLHGMTAYNGYLYTGGGWNSPTTYSTVYSAQILGNGQIGTWQTLNTMPAPQSDHNLIATNGYLFSFAGCNNSCSLSVIYSAPIKPDGTVGTWATTTTNLPVTLNRTAATVANGYFYIFGGSTANSNSTAVSTVYTAKINNNGTTEAWVRQSLLPNALWQAGAVAANGYVYVVGGMNTSGVTISTVYAAPIQSEALAFNTTNALTNGNLIDAWNGTTAVFNVDYKGTVNTNTGIQINQTSTTPTANMISSLNGLQAGAIGSWQTLANAPQATRDAGVVSHNGYIFLLGGNNGSPISTVYSAQIKADGTIGAWQTLNTLPATLFRSGVNAYNGYLYILGGMNASSLAVSTVYSAKINTDGTIATWNTLNTLPQTLYSLQTMTTNGYLFVTGGSQDSTIQSTVYSAQILGNGTIGTWQTLNTLPGIVRFFAGTSYNGYLYVAGGCNSGCAGAAILSTVYTAAVKADGTIGTWQTLNTLPAVTNSFSLQAANGYLYSLGGQTTSNAVFSTIHAAKISADGTIGTWALINTLPSIMAPVQATISNGYLFTVAGSTDGGTTKLSTVYSAPLQSTAFAFNTTNTFTNGNLMDVWNGNTSVAGVDYTGRFLTNSGIQLNNGSTPQANLVSTINPTSAGSTGSYQTLTSLPAIRHSHRMVATGGYLYLLGGNDGSAYISTAYSAKINADGTTGAWTVINTLPALKGFHGLAAYNGYLFLTGGCSGASCATNTSTVYSAKLIGDGTIGSWNTLNTLPALTRSHGSVAANGYLFVAGGSGPLSTVYSAQILGNGTIGTWQTLNTLPVITQEFAMVESGGYLFKIGGYTGSVVSTVYSAAIKSDGTIGSWQTLNTIPQLLTGPSATALNGYIYLAGGSTNNTDASAVSTVYTAKVNADGTIGTWATLNTLPSLTWLSAVANSGGFMYIAGGINSSATSLSTVYSTPLQSNALAVNTSNTFTAGNLLDLWNAGQSKFSVDYNGNLTAGGVSTATINSNVQGIAAGSTGSYQTLTNLPVVNKNAAVVSYNGYIYAIGGNTGSVVSTSYFAKANADGTIGVWSTTTALPAIRYLHASAVYNGYVFILGGNNGSAVSTVYSSKFNADGTLGSWNTLNTLPAINTQLSAVAYGGYLFALGGNNDTLDLSTVYSAQINGNGTIGTWQTLNTLPVLLEYSTAVAYNGYIFMVGGQNASALSTVYSVAIKSDGTIGTWQTLSTLPIVLSIHVTVAYNGYLYVFGGSSHSTVYAASIKTDGTIGSWSTLNTLPTLIGYSGGTVANGYFYIVGGYNNVALVSTVYSTPLQSNALALNAGSVAGAQTNGNLLDIQNNGSSKFAIDYNGNVQASGFTFNPASPTPSAQFASSVNSIPAGGIGAITTNTSYPLGIEAITAVSYNGYVYALGGDTGGTESSTAYYSKVSADGTLGPWIRFNLAAAAYNIQAATYQGYLFTVGGFTASTTLSTVYSAKINSDGSVGSWQTLAVAPIETAYGGAIAVDGYLYVVDGSSSTSSVYSAAILADGKLGSWNTLTVLPVLLGGFGLAHYNGVLYTVGGECSSGASCPNGASGKTSVVYSAKITKPGTLGTWSSVGVLPARTGDNGAFVANGHLYSVAGNTDSGTLSTIYSAKINSDGTFGNWATIAAFPQIMGAMGVTTANGFMITVAGNGTSNRISTVYTAPLQSTAFAFSATNTMTNGNLLDVWNGGITKASVDYAGNLSIAGQFQSSVTPSQDGAIGTWSTLNTLPALGQGAGNVAYNGYLYSFGGHNNTTYVSTVYSARINNDGTIGTWQTLNTMPALRFIFGIAASDGYAFILGGETTAAATVSTVYSVPLKADGTIGTWQTLNTLPALNTGLGVTASSGYLFIAGGYTGAAYLSTVYSAKINADGTIGTWATLNTIPALAGYLSMTSYNGYLFVSGGYNGSAYLSTVYSAPIKSDGTIGTWATLNTLAALTGYHSTAAYDGYLYVVGGYNGTALSTVYSAAIKADGTISNWGTLATLPALVQETTPAIYNGYIFITGGRNQSAAISTVYSNSLTTSRAFVFNTVNPFPESSSLGGSASLFTLQNNGDARFTLDAQGNGRFLGNIYASGAVIGTPGQVGDLAENVPVADLTIEAGDVVATGGASGLVKSSRAYDSGLVGVISTQPSLLFSPETPNSRAVALAGRVPVKVSLEGGAINAGDYLTSSSQPGVAMRATRPGVVVGQALESARDGKVLAFIQVGFVDPSDHLAQLSVDTAGNLIVPRLQAGQLLLGATEATGSADGTALMTVLSKLTSAQASGSSHIAQARATVYGLQNAQVLGLETTVASQAAQIANIQTKLTLLALPTATPSEAPFEASTSAALADLNVTELFSTLQLAAVDATMSGTFQVLGDAILGNTTIAGSLSIASASGGLALSGSGITLPDTLFFQNLAGAGNVDFFNGLVTIDTNGSLTSQTISAAEVTTNAVVVDSAGQTIGTGKIVSGTASVVVEAPALTQHSKVFVTPMGNLNKPLAVLNTRPGESFEVVLPESAGSDVEFKWWIIEGK